LKRCRKSAGSGAIQRDRNEFDQGRDKRVTKRARIVIETLEKRLENGIKTEVVQPPFFNARKGAFLQWCHQWCHKIFLMVSQNRVKKVHENRG
jgi:hypothetical protein